MIFQWLLLALTVNSIFDKDVTIQPSSSNMYLKSQNNNLILSNGIDGAFVIYENGGKNNLFYRGEKICYSDNGIGECNQEFTKENFNIKKEGDLYKIKNHKLTMFGKNKCLTLINNNKMEMKECKDGESSQLWKISLKEPDIDDKLELPIPEEEKDNKNIEEKEKENDAPKELINPEEPEHNENIKKPDMPQSTPKKNIPVVSISKQGDICVNGQNYGNYWQILHDKLGYNYNQPATITDSNEIQLEEPQKQQCSDKLVVRIEGVQPGQKPPVVKVLLPKTSDGKERYILANCNENKNVQEQQNSKPITQTASVPYIQHQQTMPQNSNSQPNSQNCTKQPIVQQNPISSSQLPTNVQTPQAQIQTPDCSSINQQQISNPVTTPYLQQPVLNQRLNQTPMMKPLDYCSLFYTDPFGAAANSAGCIV